MLRLEIIHNLMDQSLNIQGESVHPYEMYGIGLGPIE